MLFRRSSGGGLSKVTQALSVACGIAHLTFLTMFGWRGFADGGVMRFVNLFFALLAGVGFGLNFLGYMVLKYGGRTKAGKLGVYAIAASTALAALLLALASWTGSG